MSDPSIGFHRFFWRARPPAGASEAREGHHWKGMMLNQLFDNPRTKLYMLIKNGRKL